MLISPLHLLPAVPGIPFSGSRWQKSGEGARYSKSLAAGGLTCESRGNRAVLDPIRVRRTWEGHDVERASLETVKGAICKSWFLSVLDPLANKKQALGLGCLTVCQTLLVLVVVVSKDPCGMTGFRSIIALHRGTVGSSCQEPTVPD